ncbi:peptidase [Williamsia sp. 1135]|nr:M23 family metallopeptidase [Williamsia sp. 1135]ORM24217.1 peptidase [Williamsia sp. 1135]
MRFWWALVRAAVLLTVLATAPPFLAELSASPAHAAPRGSADFGWPLTPTPAVVKGFDPPGERWLPGHRGVDLAAPAGAVVRAAGRGVINFAGTVGGKPVVSIRHSDGLLTTYEPVTASIRSGQPVNRGAPIGTLVAGHAGCSTPCLHWGARRGAGASAVYFDPLALLGQIQVRLKPIAPEDHGEPQED